jgi:uncharacterized protein (DUF1800 family)
MATEQAYIAATRFGYGPRPGDLRKIAADPKRWLRAQIGDLSVPQQLRKLEASPKQLAEMFRQQGNAGTFGKFLRGTAFDVLAQEVGSRTNAAIESDTPFRERLVHFWSNHFTVSAKRATIAIAVGAFEREAIRPNIFGRFADLLVAVTQHPTMLIYLDNHVSFGPKSVGGRRRDVGLNENLAREILELHTLGVDGGYTQDDVIELAKLISGWSVQRPQDPGGTGTAGVFFFRPWGHEPGRKRLLGKTYRGKTVDEGEQALRDLAAHPSTARFIATKLARHFVADEPTPETVTRLEAVFHDTDGDLHALAEALIEEPDIWDTPLSKFKTPNDLLISSFRALNAKDLPNKAVAGAFHLMNQYPFTAPSPAGWSDQTADWMSPEALMTRIEWIRAVGKRAPVPNPLEWADSFMGPVLSDETRHTIGQAESQSEAVALIFSSPEFQRK